MITSNMQKIRINIKQQIAKLVTMGQITPPTI